MLVLPDFGEGKTQGKPEQIAVRALGLNDERQRVGRNRIVTLELDTADFLAGELDEFGKAPTTRRRCTARCEVHGDCQHQHIHCARRETAWAEVAQSVSCGGQERTSGVSGFCKAHAIWNATCAPATTPGNTHTR